MCKINPAFVIPSERFDNDGFVEGRVHAVPANVQGAMRTTLRYLYFTDGPKNLPATRKKLAEPFLEDGEKIVVRWLHPRTNGQLHKSYGLPALQCARKARYRCQE